MPELSLPHQMLLIQLDDQRGTSHVDSTWAQYLLAGALAAELQVSDRLVTTGADSFAIRQSVDSLPGVLGHAEEKLRGSERTMKQTLEALVGFWGISELSELLLEELIASGAVTREIDRILFIPWRWRYPTDNPEIERTIIAALKRYLDEVKPADPPDRPDLLLSLLRAGDLLDRVWTESALKRKLPKIHERTKRAPIGKIVKSCVDDAIAAATAVAIATIT